MITIPKTYYPNRLKTIRKLLTSQGLTAVLIFNSEKEDPALLPWVLGNYMFDSTYFLVTKTKQYVFVPQWRLADAYARFTQTPAEIVGTGEKATMIPFIKPYLKGIKSIGYAGNAPYKELLLLKGIKLKNIELALRDIYEQKDELEIKLEAQVENFTRAYMQKFDWKKWIGKTEKEIAKWIEDDMWKRGLPICHLCITAGPRTKETSSGFPSDYRLKKDDMICWDFGVGMQTYYSDITYCYFLGKSKDKYEKYYLAQKKAVLATADRITAGTVSSDILELLREEYTKAGIGEYFVETDLGHGIGTGNHEYPEIGHDKSILRVGTAYTLEPEARLPDGTLIRYEDVFYIGKDKKTHLLG